MIRELTQSWRIDSPSSSTCFLDSSVGAEENKSVASTNHFFCCFFFLLCFLLFPFGPVEHRLLCLLSVRPSHCAAQHECHYFPPSHEEVLVLWNLKIALENHTLFHSRPSSSVAAPLATAIVVSLPAKHSAGLISISLFEVNTL